MKLKLNKSSSGKFEERAQWEVFDPTQDRYRIFNLLLKVRNSLSRPNTTKHLKQLFYLKQGHWVTLVCNLTSKCHLYFKLFSLFVNSWLASIKNGLVIKKTNTKLRQHEEGKKLIDSLKLFSQKSHLNFAEVRKSKQVLKLALFIDFKN